MGTTAPITPGQVKDLSAALVQAIPVDLPSDVAQAWIGRKSVLGSMLGMVLRGEIPEPVPGIDWAKAYKALGMEAEYAKFALSIVSRPDLWVVPVVKGVTCNKVVAALKALGVDVYLYISDLDRDVRVNDRDPANGSYSVGFLRTVEADEANKGLSADQLRERKHQGITLLERLLLELGYFLATGNHLDVENVTLCSGSRNSDGNVPRVDWRADGREVYVSWCNSGSAGGNLRSRSVVS